MIRYIRIVLLIDYSVWYKGQQIGYMKSNKSCIDPFYDKVYNNLKSSKEEVKKKKFKEGVSAAESTPASFLLDTESEVEIGKGLLRSVIADLARLIREKEE